MRWGTALAAAAMAIGGCGGNAGDGAPAPPAAVAAALERCGREREPVERRSPAAKLLPDDALVFDDVAQGPGGVARAVARASPATLVNLVLSAAAAAGYQQTFFEDEGFESDARAASDELTAHMRAEQDRGCPGLSEITVSVSPRGA